MQDFITIIVLCLTLPIIIPGVCGLCFVFTDDMIRAWYDLQEDIKKKGKKK